MSHGRQVDYQRGCRCEICRAAQRRASKLRAMGRAGLVDATPVAERLRQLQADHWSDKDIAAVLRLPESRVASLRRMETPRVRVSTRDKVLGATFAKRRPQSLIPAHGARRRLQALACMGWTIRAVAKAAGIPESTAGWLACEDGNQRVTQAVHDAIAETYERMAGTPGPSRLARSRARNRGWLPPAVWDEIDDPDEQPDLGALRSRRQSSRIDWDEVDDLLGLGYTVEQINERLGFRPHALADMMRRRQRRQAC